MKRSACSILAMLLLVSALSMNCYAIDDKSEIYNTIHFDDGSYLTECIYITQTRSSGTVSGRKVDTWYIVSKSASKSGNKATASVTMGLKHLV